MANAVKDNKYEWDEDLVQGVRARYQQAWQQKSSTQYQWKQGADAVEAIRKPIRLTKTGKIYNLDAKQLSKRVYEECVKIIQQESTIFPDGYVQLSSEEVKHLQENTMMPYVEQMAQRSGAYAMLLAFHISGKDSLSKQEMIRLGQPHCSTEMESNYHAGRMYGAWKAKDTLVRHGLITEHKAGVRYTPVGFRSNGQNTYSISSDGKLAIRQMFQKWPNLRAETETNISAAWDDDRHEPLSFGFRSPFPSVASHHHITTSTLTRKKSHLSANDEQELRDWLKKAAVGQQKAFKVGKDRRKYLHNLCDQLEREHAGLSLQHESQEGAGVARRDLYITLRKKPDGMGAVSPPAAVNTMKRRASSLPIGAGTGQSLGGATKKPRSAAKAAATAALSRFEQNNSLIRTSGSKRARRVQPIKHHPIVELLDDSDDERDVDRKIPAKTRPNEVSLDDSDNEQLENRHLPAKSKPNEIFLDDSDNETEEDRKLHAKPKPNDASNETQSISPSVKPHNPYDYQPDDHCILKNSRTECLILRVHVCGHVTILLPDGREQRVSVRDVEPCPQAILDHAAFKASGILPNCKASYKASGTLPNCKASPSKAVAAVAFDPDVDIVDLCRDDNDDDGPVNDIASSRAAKLSHEAPSDETGLSDQHPLLTILIDNRERSRNHKPRELRTELTKELASVSFRNAWPPELPCAAVEEHNLHYGDFAFVDSSNNGGRQKRLSVVVERKRVADLVQRSAYGDHWKQISRMRDCCQHAIMLIENDTKFASRFDAYGSQSLKRRPGQHSIESPEDVFLFIGRAILSSKRIKFIQTNDTRASFRSIGATGLMAHASAVIQRNAPLKTPFAATEQNRLSDRLTSGGIHWQAAKEVAFEFGSISALEAAFSACHSATAKEYLMVPVLQNMEENVECEGSRLHWSRGIYRVFSADDKLRTQKRRSLDSILTMVGNNVCDPAVLLCSVYAEDNADAALNAAMDDQSFSLITTSRRQVTIEINAEFGPCFDTPESESFYSLRISESNPWSLPCCQMATIAGPLSSGMMKIFLLEGSSVVHEASKKISESSSLVDASKTLARKWVELCRVEDNNEDKTDRTILLIRGLGPALDKAAKDAGFQPETHVFCQMVFAAIMLEHDMVVLQSFRKKQEETAMILQQLALACYRHQLLYHHKNIPTET